jgi:3-oxoadipate enol-lactonase
MNPFDHDLERGLRNRRGVLGDAWVDRSLSKANAFNADFQAFINRYAWHEIWGRPGLDHRTRRIIVLATTLAMGRWEEFELHVRAALSGGDPATRLSVDELKEVLIQSAIYAGVPAANTGHALTLEILRSLGPEFEHHLQSMAVPDVAHPGVGRSHFTEGKPRLHYTVREPRLGATPRRTIVMSHALGCDLMMWDALANALSAHDRVVCYDSRGHGLSDAPPGPYTMPDLADDAARLIDELQLGPVTWLGLSMGGMVGQELALRHPGKVAALIVANTTSGYPAEAQAGWAQRIQGIEAGGLEAVVDGALQRWFHEGFHQAQAATVARWRRRVVSTDQAGYIACCQAIAGVDTTSRLPQINVPTLVIAGDLDVGTPPTMARTIAQAVPGACLLVLPEASHLSVLEQPAAFRDGVQSWLTELG